MIINLDYFNKHSAPFKDHFTAQDRLREWENWIGGVAGTIEPSARTKNLDEQLIDRLTKEAIEKLIAGLMSFDTITLQARPWPVKRLLQEHKPSNRIATLIYRAACENFPGIGNATGGLLVTKTTYHVVYAIFNDLIKPKRIVPHPGNQFALKLQALRSLGHVNQTKNFRANPPEGTNSDDNNNMGGRWR